MTTFAHQGRPAGFITLPECFGLYAQGVFGTIAELYVRPEYRGQRLASGLIAEANALASSRGWLRLEVATPPLAEFARTLAFLKA